MNWSGTLAKVIIRGTNPCLLSVAVLLVAGRTESSDEHSLLVEALAIVLFLVVLPAVYVYLRIPADRRSKKRPGDLIQFLRDHPRDITILGMTFALPCIVVLAVYLGASSLVVTTLVVLLVTSVAASVVNMFHRVSYHLAAGTSLAIMAGVIWEWTFPATLACVPLIGWAKLTLREHTPGELLAGFGLGAIVAVTISGLRGTLGVLFLPLA